MEILHFKINGLSALLMHSPASMQPKTAEQLKARGQVFDPGEEAAKSRYLLPDGNLYIPAIAVRNSLLNGSKGYTVAPRRAARPVLAAAIIIADEAFPLLDGNGNPKGGDDYTIDSRRAVVQRQGIIRSRAKIELPWQLECAFSFNSELIPINIVEQALRNAGQVVGLLDYRPEKSGWFGRFEVANIWSE